MGLNFFAIVVACGIGGIVCGLAGLITYPHKLSLVLLIIGFFVAGFFSNSYDLTDFLFFGGLFGIPAGALISRVLYWLKVIK